MEWVGVCRLVWECRNALPCQAWWRESERIKKGGMCEDAKKRR